MEGRSMFLAFMGQSPMMRVLDVLLTERDMDFSLTDLARSSGVGQATLNRLWNRLLSLNVVVPARTPGRTTLYRLDRSNKLVRNLIEIDNGLIRADLKQRTQKSLSART